MPPSIIKDAPYAFDKRCLSYCSRFVTLILFMPTLCGVVDLDMEFEFNFGEGASSDYTHPQDYYLYGSCSLESFDAEDGPPSPLLKVVPSLIRVRV